MIAIEIPEAVQVEYDRIMDRWELTGEVPMRLKLGRPREDGTVAEVWCHLDDITSEFAREAFAHHQAKVAKHLARYAAEPSPKLAKHIAEHLAFADLAYSQIKPEPRGAP
jgi:hypothetical protein